MAEMGSYCKAYKLGVLRQYPSWLEKPRPSEQHLDDEHIVYLQENLSVTDGIFIDQDILFDTVDEKWERFCQETLKFKIPTYQET